MTKYNLIWLSRCIFRLSKRSRLWMLNYVKMNFLWCIVVCNFQFWDSCYSTRFLCALDRTFLLISWCFLLLICVCSDLWVLSSCISCNKFTVRLLRLAFRVMGFYSIAHLIQWFTYYFFSPVLFLPSASLSMIIFSYFLMKVLLQVILGMKEVGYPDSVFDCFYLISLYSWIGNHNS